MEHEDIINRETVLRMAREAGIPVAIVAGNPSVAQIERFAQMVAEHEREACAMVCDDKHHTWRWDDEPDSASGPRDCAAAIRARSNA